MRRRVRVVLIAAAALAAVTGVAIAAIPSAQSVIVGCAQNRTGDLRVVGSARQCRRNETPLRWNQRGPAGPAGPPGLPGAAGKPGPPGRSDGFYAESHNVDIPWNPATGSEPRPPIVVSINLAPGGYDVTGSATVDNLGTDQIAHCTLIMARPTDLSYDGVPFGSLAQADIPNGAGGGGETTLIASGLVTVSAPNTTLRLVCSTGPFGTPHPPTPALARAISSYLSAVQVGTVTAK